MHDIESAIIWFYAVSMGMILTMVMAGLAAQPCRPTVNQDASTRITTYHFMPRPEGMVLLINSSALGTACITSERETTVTPQAA